jgi:hypothetical protein
MVFDKFVLPVSAYIYLLFLTLVSWTYIRGLLKKNDERIFIPSGFQAKLGAVTLGLQTFSAIPFIVAPLGTIWLLQSFPNVASGIEFPGFIFHSITSFLLLFLLAKACQRLPKAHLFALGALGISAPLAIPLGCMFTEEINVKRGLLIALSLWPGGLLTVLLAMLIVHRTTRAGGDAKLNA